MVRTIPSWVQAIYVVDDGSTDSTAQQVQALDDPRVRLLTHARNRGVGAAIATGYARALVDKMQVLCVLAGDGQMDPDDLAAVIAPILQGEAGYVKGNRLKHRSVTSVMPAVRLAGNVTLSTLTRWVTGLWHIGDSQCGYTAMSAQIAAQIDFAQLWPRYGYPNDLLATLARMGVPVRDVVVRPVYEGAPSGIRWSDALVTIPAILLRASWRRARTVWPTRAVAAQKPAHASRSETAQHMQTSAVDAWPYGDASCNERSQNLHPGGGSL